MSDFFEEQQDDIFSQPQLPEQPEHYKPGARPGMTDKYPQG